MEIVLKITVEDERCGDCIFKDSDWLDETAKCLLFNEPLKPHRKYGDIEYWDQCHQCRLISRKRER